MSVVSIEPNHVITYLFIAKITKMYSLIILMLFQKLREDLPLKPKNVSLCWYKHAFCMFDLSYKIFGRKFSLLSLKKSRAAAPHGFLTIA